MNIISKLALSATLLFTSLTASEEVPTQEEVAKLYVATFNRAPDSAGLTWWTNNSNLKLSEIAQSFFDQDETKALYPTDTTNADFITSVYQNLFNRTPDTDGLNYWENELNIGSFSKNSFIQAVIKGAQNTDISKDEDILTNKTSVGLSFAQAGKEDPEEAKSIMISVSADASSVTSALDGFGISLYSESNADDSSSSIDTVEVDSESTTLSSSITLSQINTLLINVGDTSDKKITWTTSLSVIKIDVVKGGSEKADIGYMDISEREVMLYAYSDAQIGDISIVYLDFTVLDPSTNQEVVVRKTIKVMIS